jgi:hypothetical protein
MHAEFSAKTLGKRPLGRYRSRWEDIIKMAREVMNGTGSHSRPMSVFDTNIAEPLGFTKKKSPLPTG